MSSPTHKGKGDTAGCMCAACKEAAFLAMPFGAGRVGERCPYCALSGRVVATCGTCKGTGQVVVAPGERLDPGDELASHRVFAVVHVQNQAQAVRNCTVAHEAGCDGAFLIAHRTVSWIELATYLASCSAAIPYVGVNFLDLSAPDAVTVAAAHVDGFDAVWTDATYLGRKPDGIEVFSGFAFKHQPQPRDLVVGAQVMSGSCDVVTTSGPATGLAADVEHVQKIRNAIGSSKRLALASGITAANVASFMPYVNDFLVATSISAGWQELDPQKTARLVSTVKRAGAVT